MAIAHFENESRVNDFHFGWTADWNDATRDLTVNCFHEDDRGVFTAQQLATQGEAKIFVELQNGSQREFDPFALNLVNAGPTVFSNVNLRRFADKGGGIVIPYSTSYKPPTR